MKGCITKYWTWEGGTGSDKVRSSPQVLDDRSGIPGFQATSSRTQPFPSHWPLPLTHIPLVSTHRSRKSTSWGSSEIRSSGAKLSANVSRLESFLPVRKQVPTEAGRSKDSTVHWPAGLWDLEGRGGAPEGSHGGVTAFTSGGPQSFRGKQQCLKGRERAKERGRRKERGRKRGKRRQVGREKVFWMFFNWRIISLQYCIGFCHTSTWISHRYTYVPSIWNLPPTSHSILPLWFSWTILLVLCPIRVSLDERFSAEGWWWVWKGQDVVAKVRD